MRVWVNRPCRAPEIRPRRWSTITAVSTVDGVGELLAQMEASTTLLPADELHVWDAGLEPGTESVRRLRSLLAEDELERADRFRFERDRSRYTVGRGLLRILLGRYLGVDPKEIAFEYGEYGKPKLASASHPSLSFNLSHSGALALFAFSASGELGVDVELERAEPDYARLADRYFSRSEAGALRALPARLRPAAFLACWTRKEAFIKARGDGLSLALDSFDVTLVPGQPAAVVRTAWSSQEPTQWSLQDLTDAELGYVAAVAIRQTGWRLVRRRIPDSFYNQKIETEDQ
jgi:4'-phosphopantetheinyl transferase